MFKIIAFTYISEVGQIFLPAEVRTKLTLKKTDSIHFRKTTYGLALEKAVKTVSDLQDLENSYTLVPDIRGRINLPPFIRDKYLTPSNRVLFVDDREGEILLVPDQEISLLDSFFS